MRKVDYFIIGDKKFVPHNDTFAAILYDSPQMRLTQYVQCKWGRLLRKDGSAIDSSKSLHVLFCLKMGWTIP